MCFNMVAKKKNLLTKEWYERLVNELHDLKDNVMPSIIKRIWEAKAMWDLSENFDYKMALEDKELTMSRIDSLESLLDGVEIIDDSKLDKWSIKYVDYWSTVVVRLEDKKEYTIKIVWSWEVDVSDWNLNISFNSPIWKAIRWKRVWDVVKMRVLEDRQMVEVVDIK